LSSNAVIFISAAAALSALSFILDRQKTLAGFKKGWQMFRKILLPFLNILIVVSVALFLIPPSAIDQYLGAESGIGGFFVAAAIGSVALIPPFISYPIAAGLLQQGATYAVVATLITTLIMVGVVTLPLEAQYFGKRVAIIRNGLNFVAAILIGLLIGVIL
jgi:uncharacterized membrane protein YraQ (UPF0718 family)